MHRSIDVIVPVHNHWELTKSCLTHLRRQTAHHTVIVCDNGSTDGTPERVRASFPEARVLELGANLGFSAACNRGVSVGNAEIVVLLNNDVDCRHDFLERLVEPFDLDPRVGSVAALLLTPGEETIESFGLTADATLASFPRLRGEPARAVRNARHILVGPSGAAGAYRRHAWDEVGGLDEGVVSYGEDLDLAVRLREAGWPTQEAPDAVAVHIGSATASLRSAWQRYQSGFARGYFLRRYRLLRGRVALRAAATEAIVVLADALVFSHDLVALRGRIAGWCAARGLPASLQRPRRLIDSRISFLESLTLRLDVFTGREPPGK